MCEWLLTLSRTKRLRRSLSPSISHIARMPGSRMSSTRDGIGSLVARQVGVARLVACRLKAAEHVALRNRHFDFLESGAPWFHCLIFAPLARASAISCSRFEPCGDGSKAQAHSHSRD